MITVLQSAEQLEYNAHAGQAFKGIAAIVAAGIHNDAIRDFVLALMMVGNNQFQAKLRRQLCFFAGSDACIHCNHHAAAFFADGPQGAGIDAVALVDAVRNVVIRVRSIFPKPGGKDTDRGDSVYVIISVHRDFFLLFQRAADCRYSLLHIMEQKRRMKIRRRFCQIALQVFRISYAAVKRHRGGKGRDSRFAGQRFRLVGVGRIGEVKPAFIHGRHPDRRRFAAMTQSQSGAALHTG